MKRALITGITGQDGSYLAEFLLSKGYNVYGMLRRTSTDPFERISHLKGKVEFVSGDLTDMGSLLSVLTEAKPDEVYNLAAQSFVPASFTQPILTSNITALGALNLLEAIRHTNPKIKYYQASSSEMFGKALETPQKESTPFNPRSPYGFSKVFAHNAAKNYRESYGMFCSSGILFNHESPRRGLQFVTRKISDSVAKIKLGLQEHLVLGNLDAKRDWGFAGDYVEAMWMILQHKEADDFVIATGETHSVREFCEIAFRHVGLDYKNFVTTDPKFLRPAEVDTLIGDAAKARKILGWKPHVSFKELVHKMVDSDLERHNHASAHNRK